MDASSTVTTVCLSRDGLFAVARQPRGVSVLELATGEETVLTLEGEPLPAVVGLATVASEIWLIVDDPPRLVRLGFGGKLVAEPLRLPSLEGGDDPLRLVAAPFGESAIFRGAAPFELRASGREVRVEAIQPGASLLVPIATRVRLEVRDGVLLRVDADGPHALVPLAHLGAEVIEDGAGVLDGRAAALVGSRAGARTLFVVELRGGLVQHRVPLEDSSSVRFAHARGHAVALAGARLSVIDLRFGRVLRQWTERTEVADFAVDATGRTMVVCRRDADGHMGLFVGGYRDAAQQVPAAAPLPEADSTDDEEADAADAADADGAPPEPEPEPKPAAVPDVAASAAPAEGRPVEAPLGRRAGWRPGLPTRTTPTPSKPPTGEPPSTPAPEEPPLPQATEPGARLALARPPLPRRPLLPARTLLGASPAATTKPPPLRPAAREGRRPPTLAPMPAAAAADDAWSRLAKACERAAAADPPGAREALEGGPFTDGGFLAGLAARIGLDEPGGWLLVAAAAPWVRPELLAALASVGPTPEGLPSLQLVARLLGRSPAELLPLLDDGAPLSRFRLVARPASPTAPLRASPLGIAGLAGLRLDEEGPADAAVRVLSGGAPQPAPREADAAEKRIDRLAAVLDAGGRVQLVGRAGSGMRSLAAALGARLGVPLGLVAATEDTPRLEGALVEATVRGLLPCVAGPGAVDEAQAAAVAEALARHPGPLLAIDGVSAPALPGFVVEELPARRPGRLRTPALAATHNEPDRPRLSPGLTGAPAVVEAPAHRFTRDALALLAARGRRAREGQGPAVLAALAGEDGSGRATAAAWLARSLGADLHRVAWHEIAACTFATVDGLLDAVEAEALVLHITEGDELLASPPARLAARLGRFGGTLLVSSGPEAPVHASLRALGIERVPFPLPEPEARLALWRSRWPASLDVDAARLASLPLHAGGIVRAVERAVLLAEAEGRPLSADHLDRALRLTVEAQKPRV